MSELGALPDRRQETEALQLLLDQVYELTGYDFRDFSLEAMRRRAAECARDEGLQTLDELRARVLQEPKALGRLVETLASRGGELFRDPAFFAALRKSAVPHLRTYPSLRIWHAGCGTGEETYSLAVLLKEEGLLQKSRIYATDLSPSAIRTARAGSYGLDALRGANQRYAASGGKGRLSEHCPIAGPLATFDLTLRAGITFSEFSLATDASFNEFHLIVCRDVIVNFNRSLQDRVFGLVSDSLCPFGILGLGRSHTLRRSPAAVGFEALDESANLYRKVP